MEVNLLSDVLYDNHYIITVEIKKVKVNVQLIESQNDMASSLDNSFPLCECKLLTPINFSFFKLKQQTQLKYDQ